MKMVTLGPIANNVAGIERVLRGGVQKLHDLSDGPPKLVITYHPYGSDDVALLKAIRSVVDCPVIGATTGGCSFTERGMTTDGITMAIIGGDVEVESALARNVSPQDSSALVAALETLPKPRGRHQVVFTLADPFAMDGEALAKMLKSHTSATTQHLGGTAGDSFTFEGPKVFYGDESLQGAVAVVSLLSNEAPIGSVRHGFSAVHEDSMTVTKCAGPVLIELDGRPALEVYRERLIAQGFLPETASTADVFNHGTVLSFGMRSIFNRELKVRAPMSFDAEANTILLTGGLDEGGQIVLVTGSPETLLEASTQIASLVYDQIKEANRTPSGSLVVNCAGRLAVLQDAFANEVSALSGDGAVPTIGFASYGELARLKGKLEGFHSTSAVLVSW